MTEQNYNKAIETLKDIAQGQIGELQGQYAVRVRHLAKETLSEIFSPKRNEEGNFIVYKLMLKSGDKYRTLYRGFEMELGKEYLSEAGPGFHFLIDKDSAIGFAKTIPTARVVECETQFAINTYDYRDYSSIRIKLIKDITDED